MGTLRSWRFISKRRWELTSGPEGWNNWDKPASEKTAYFAEYNSKGAGANPAGRVNWAHQLTTAEATQFEPENFLKSNDGWNPKVAD